MKKIIEFEIYRRIYQLLQLRHSSQNMSKNTKRPLVQTEIGQQIKKAKNPVASGSSSATDSGSHENFLQSIKAKREGVSPSIKEFKFNKRRVRIISKNEDVPDDCSAIVYWMSRDQRVQDNWALLYAQRLALKVGCPLVVCFCLVPKFLEATLRHYSFMLKGLQEVETECETLDIQFHLLIGYAKDVLPKFVKEHGIGGVITDFAPLRVPQQWVQDVKKALPSNVPLCQVDSHNLVPCWIASDKLEYGARTIRRKIMDKLPEYLTEFPPVITHPHKAPDKLRSPKIDWQAAFDSLEIDRSVGEVEWAKPGTSEGLKELNNFINKRLRSFADLRNDPTKDNLSNLSPWIHFGQLSVQRCILSVQSFKSKYAKSVEAYIEEAVVRRELSDNFCYYCPNYDNMEGAWEWARKTLRDHAKDKRDYLYSRDALENAKTHDTLWNAAQRQMVHEGKMHGFLRMYWAKKILEWTKSPEEALSTAIYLNDKYELDGRDPNGYVGCMWSICGLHDQGWAERPVFGKIRYMNFKGCQRKFNVEAFVMKYRKYK